MTWSGSKTLLNLIKISQKTIMKKVKKAYFLEVDVPYLEKLHKPHIDLPFLTRKNEN